MYDYAFWNLSHQSVTDLQDHYIGKIKWEQLSTRNIWWNTCHNFYLTQGCLDEPTSHRGINTRTSHTPHICLHSLHLLSFLFPNNLLPSSSLVTSFPPYLHLSTTAWVRLHVCVCVHLLKCICAYFKNMFFKPLHSHHWVAKDLRASVSISLMCN